MAFLKSLGEIELMAEAGQILARVIRELVEHAKIGTTTNFLDKLSFELIESNKAKPAFLGYRPAGAKRPFPKTLCASVNEVVVHGLPSDYCLQNGDLLKIDLGLEYQGFFVDSAITVGVGRISRKARKLIEVTRNSLDLAIKNLSPGLTLGDIGYTIENYARKNKFSIIRSLTGHGIGRQLHEEPTVLNFGKPNTGLELVPGMVLAIEPMISLSNLDNGCNIQELKDGSYATKDKSLSAHFEHTVAITEAGPRVLTRL